MLIGGENYKHFELFTFFYNHGLTASLSVLNHRVDYSDTGNGGLAQKTTTKQQKTKQNKTKKKNVVYRWSLRTPDLKTSRDVAPATA